MARLRLVSPTISLSVLFPTPLLALRGSQVCEVIVHARLIQYDALKIGDHYDFDYDNKGNLLNVFIED